VFKDQGPEFWSGVEEVDIALVLFAGDFASKGKADPLLYRERRREK